MTTVRKVTFENGAVRFVRKLEAASHLLETTGNTTITETIPAAQAHYEVGFYIVAKLEQSGVHFENAFEWLCLVPEQGDQAQYRTIENEAARQIAPMLRAIADRIEMELDDIS